VRIRTKRHRLPAAAYYGEVAVAITACEAHRRDLFSDHAIVSVFVGEMTEAADRFSCIIPVYCFMPDHLHLIIKGLDPRSRPKFAVERFKHQTGNWLKENAPSFSWQDDFYDHIIRKSEDWNAQIQYIAANPMRAGLAEDMLTYPFTGSIGCDLGEVLLSTI
jgi:putative transposase